MTTSIDDAFQTLLTSVGDMNLKEGDFLHLNNVLKKAYENRKPSKTKYLNFHISLEETLDEDACYELVLMTNNTCENDHRHCICNVTVLGKSTYKGKIVMTSTPVHDVDNRLRALINLLQPKKIIAKLDGLEFVYTYEKMYERWCKQEGDDADENLDPTYSNVTRSIIDQMCGGLLQMVASHNKW